MVDTAVVYRIKIQGTVPDAWIDRLGGLQVTAATPEQSTLEGDLPDQAALIGVINALYTLHLPIVEVTRLKEQKANA